MATADKTWRILKRTLTEPELKELAYKVTRACARNNLNEIETEEALTLALEEAGFTMDEYSAIRFADIERITGVIVSKASKPKGE